MRTLKIGRKGNDVRMLQYVLGGLEVDGEFGPLTEERLEQVQKELDLVADGKCGPLTQKALNLKDFMVTICDPMKVKFVGTKYDASIKPLRTLRQWAEFVPGARFVFNLAFFNLTGSGHDRYGVIKGRTLTYVKGDGKDIGYGGTDLKIYPNPRNACAGYKVGIENGKKKAFPVVAQKRARNANGMLKDGRYFHVQSVMPCTEYALVNYMYKNYDVKTLLIQDSGGSTGCLIVDKDVMFAAEIEGKDGRAVATVAVICE